MSQRYSRPPTEQEKEQLMASRKKVTSEVKERASVSRERRIALALRAVLEQSSGNDGEGQGTAFADADTTLSELGFRDLVGIPQRIAELEGQLHAATGAKDYAQVAKLGLELDRVKAGRVSKVVVAEE